MVRVFNWTKTDSNSNISHTCQSDTGDNSGVFTDERINEFTLEQLGDDMNKDAPCM